MKVKSLLLKKKLKKLYKVCSHAITALTLLVVLVAPDMLGFSVNSFPVLLYLSVTQTSRSCETVESRCYSLKEAGVSPTTLDTDYRHNYMIIIVTENMFFSFWSEDLMLNATGTDWEIHSSTREREVTHV